MPYDTQVIDATTITDGVILHGVNCQGAMGSGIAGALARKWPQVRNKYLELVAAWREQGAPHFHSAVMLGVTQIVPITDELQVVNCFTQDTYGADGRRHASPEAIRKALTQVFHDINNYVDTVEVSDGWRVYMPQIGCGLGGLSWEQDVKPIVDELHADCNFPLTIMTL